MLTGWLFSQEKEAVFIDREQSPVGGQNQRQFKDTTLVNFSQAMQLNFNCP
jgi:hypothetical protein